MEESKSKKYFWLKLKRDFFKRHDITILEAMPNGKEYSLFYLKLMLESIDHEGRLRFNDQIPYNETMLAAITNTNVDTVRSAIKVLEQLGLLEILDDATIYMTEVENMMGFETEWAEKKRIYRENKKKELEKDNVHTMSDKRLELELDIEIDKRKDINVEKKEPIASDFSACDLDEMTLKMKKHKYGKYKNILLTDEEYEKLANRQDGLKAIEYLSEYREYKGYKAKSDYLAILKWVFNAMKEERIKQERIENAEAKKTRFTESDKPFDQAQADLTTIPDEELGNVQMCEEPVKKTRFTMYYKPFNKEEAEQSFIKFEDLDKTEI